MPKPGLHPSTGLVEAEWLAQRLRPFSAHRVASVVPDDFPAYIRILHPARGINGQPVSWADVAARSGRTMHRLVQFHAIAGSSSSASGDDPASRIDPPENGNLSADLLAALCAILAGHTSTQDLCWFCLWDGYGWLLSSPAESTLFFTAPGHAFNDANFPPVPPALPPEFLQMPKVRLPQRNYFLFNGPLDAATELGWNMTGGGFVPQSPNLSWPQDHAWCIASEIDLFCTLVAGSEALAEILIADPRLEAWRVFPGDPVTWDSDEINT